MKSPYSDPRLSLRARGLYAFYIEKGRVIPSSELADSADIPEGRDAIRSAMEELKVAGYIRAVRYQVGGQWVTHLKFTDESLNLPFSRNLGKSPGHTDDGFSGASIANREMSTSTSTNYIVNIASLLTNVSKLTIEFLRNSEKEIDNMIWEMFGKEDVPVKKFRPEPEDDTSGSVGKVEDKQAARNQKYKRTVYEKPGRETKSEETWSTSDLVAEFYELSRQISQGAPSQINGSQIATWINRQVGQGVSRHSILLAMRMFFSDPRLTRGPGVGLPMWRRFFAYYPTVHGLVSKIDKETEEDLDMLKHQKKMLKLLGGD